MRCNSVRCEFIPDCLAHFAEAALLGLGIAGGCLMAPGAAGAQMPPELIDKVAAIGRVSDPAKTAPLYAPLQEQEPYTGVRVLRDVKYGSDPRNVVDIFIFSSPRAAPRAGRC
jgi:hypothetical protein